MGGFRPCDGDLITAPKTITTPGVALLVKHRRWGNVHSPALWGMGPQLQGPPCSPCQPASFQLSIGLYGALLMVLGRSQWRGFLH